MRKMLLLTAAVSGLTLSAAVAQSPAPSPTNPSANKPAATAPVPNAQSPAPRALDNNSAESNAAKPDTAKSEAAQPSGAATAAISANEPQFVAAQGADKYVFSEFKGADVIGADNKKIGDVSDVLFDQITRSSPTSSESGVPGYRPEERRGRSRRLPGADEGQRSEQCPAQSQLDQGSIERSAGLQVLQGTCQDCLRRTSDDDRCGSDGRIADGSSLTCHTTDHRRLGLAPEPFSCAVINATRAAPGGRSCLQTGDALCPRTPHANRPIASYLLQRMFAFQPDSSVVAEVVPSPNCGERRRRPPCPI